MNDPRDVSGVWYGRYFALSWGSEDNGFIAHLAESDGVVTGTITEPDTLGIDTVRRAYVDGDRSGAQLGFIKQYDPSGTLAHSVAYAGSINDDGTQVTGEWQFSVYHGSFVMNRETFSVEELADEAAVRDDAFEGRWIPTVSNLG